MKMANVRLFSGAMTVLATIAFIVSYATFVPTPANASFCCGDCEEDLAAMEAACENSTHDTEAGDTLQICGDDAWDLIYSCIAHCDECPPPTQCRMCWVWTHWLRTDPSHGFGCQYFSC